MNRQVSLGDDCRLGTRLQARIMPADHAKPRPQPLAEFRRTLAIVYFPVTYINYHYFYSSFFRA
jgi:hypothetical protein